jgi:hypothetical protein
MKKLVYAVSALAVVVSGAVELERRECGWEFECLARDLAAETPETYETVLAIEGLPLPLTDIQTLSAPLIFEEPAPGPHAQLLLPVPAVMQEGILSSMQGAWYSARDARDQFMVSGTARSNTYSGADAGEERISVSGRCGSYSGGGSYLRTQPEGGAEACYSIDSVTKSELVLTYMPTGETMHFLRME